MERQLTGLISVFRPFACRVRSGLTAHVAMLGLVTAGCGGQINPQSLATGALESIPASALAIAAGHKVPVGSPTEVYSRIARGALSCWLGGQGELRKTHSFHAVAAPRHKGGFSRIIIYRKPKVPDPKTKGVQAFRIDISKQGNSALVAAENLKLPKALGEKMVVDTHRWASGEEGCIEGGLREGWSPDLTKTTSKTGKK